LVTAGWQPATRLSRLENPMLNGEIEYLGLTPPQHGVASGSSVR
jgi:hypothetical protein